MTSLAGFFTSVRSAKLFGASLSPLEVSGCETIISTMADSPLSWIAYALATAYWETAHTMQPVKEIGGDAYYFRRYDPKGNRPDIAAKLGNTSAGDGAKYAGRGYVQLTGRANYAKASQRVGADLIANPDKALDPTIAAKIMRQGMRDGWFTGKRLADYLPNQGPATQALYEAARRIINGIDKAEDIAAIALQFQTALQAGGWK